MKKKPQPKSPAALPKGPDRFFIPVCIGLFLVVLAVFYPITSGAFLNYDDNDYITENVHVQGGLLWRQIVWAFTNTDAANWHPLTWISHMLDCQLYGPNPWGHHLASVIIHSLNAVLVCIVMRKMLGALWPALFAALLFGLHPLRVESVAWIAERKDVLSGLFWLLSIWAYLDYGRSKSIVKYWLVLACFALGLMSKPMVVTLPFALLLLDFWPLARMNRNTVAGLLWEKIPLFLLAAAGSVAAFLAQKSQGAVIEFLPLGYRLETAVLAYARYLGKFLLPVNLAILYPHPKSWSLAAVVASALLIFGLSIAAFLARRSRPYLLTGWAWYLGTLVPVIGIVQIGSQSMADRYTYIPGIGLIIVLTLGLRDWASTLPFKRPLLYFAGTASVLACAGLTVHQISFWKNSGTVFQHAIDVTDNSFFARKALGDFYTSQGKTDEAIALYRQSLEMYPSYAGAHMNLGAAFNQLGHTKEAIDEFTIAIRLQPNDASAYNDLGAVLGDGHLDESLALFEKATQISPGYVDAHMNLGQALDRKGRIADAIAQYQLALQLRPSFAAHYYLAIDYEKLGRNDEAMAHLNEILKVQPDNGKARQMLDRLTGELKK